MTETVACPDCGRRYKVTQRIAGRRIRCKECSATITVPEASETVDGEWWESGPEAPPIPSRGRTRPKTESVELDMVPASVREKKRRKLPGWMIWTGLLGGMLLLMCGGVLISAVAVYYKIKNTVVGTGESVVAGMSLAEARAKHPTVLLFEEPEPQPFDAFTISDAERITFTSDGRELFGWFAKPPGDGPFPAVLHAHGGNELGPSAFDDARPLLEAGYAIFVPAWRAENGNAGSFEFVFGEVDDAIAALDYLAARPDINADQIFATGHSMGGTLVMLLAELSPQVRGVMACGGCADVQAATILEGNSPPFGGDYDASNPIEGDLRSAARHVADLHCPMLLFFGLPDDRLYYNQALIMQEKAEEFDRSVRVEIIPRTNHFTALRPAMFQAMIFFDSLRADDPIP